jgi:phenylalanyl-tRNA synthetase alpha chain
MVAETLSQREKEILLSLDGEEEVELLAQRLGYSELVEAMSPLSWLSRKGLVEIRERVEPEYSLTERGAKTLQEGLPEARALDLVERGSSMKELSDQLGDEASIAIGWLRREGCKIEGGKFLIDEKKIADLRKKIEGEIKALENPDVKVYELLKGRGFLKRREKNRRQVSFTARGKEIADRLREMGEKPEELISQLTPELIKSGERRRLRRYDVTAFAPMPRIGKRHLLTILIERVREAFLKMGFIEIRGDYVASSFWDMDVLFIPQDHPARDLQDTFYLDKEFDLDPGVVEKVKRVHENGGDTGSKGWGYAWSEDEAKRALLRTHTTLETIRYISQHKKGPIKIFCVDRIFRREAIDPAHLPEFHQIEGVVMERGADFRELMGLFKEFYSMMGFEVRFRPSYFPYTEPSLEVQIQREGEWIELGGSGMFRPEVLGPFGIKEPVLAWGLGLERLGMVLYGIDDIRELYTDDIERLQAFHLV